MDDKRAAGADTPPEMIDLMVALKQGLAGYEVTGQVEDLKRQELEDEEGRCDES